MLRRRGAVHVHVRGFWPYPGAGPAPPLFGSPTPSPNTNPHGAQAQRDMMAERILLPMRLIVLAMAGAALLVPAAARAGKRLRLKFTAGAELQYTLTQDTTITTQAGENLQQTSLTQTSDMVWRVEAIDDGGNARIQQRFSRMRLTMNGPAGIQFEIDSADDRPPEGLARSIHPVIQALAQATFTLLMTPRGEILEIDMSDDVTAALQKIPGSSMLGDMAKKEGLTQIIKQAMPVFPEEPVEEETKWNSTFTLKNPIFGRQVVRTTYRYDGEEQVDDRKLDRIAIRVVMQIQRDADAAAPAAMKVIEQDSSGALFFNRAAGRVESSRITQSMRMQVQAAGQTMQQQIETQTRLAVTPVQDATSDASAPANGAANGSKPSAGKGQRD